MTDLGSGVSITGFIADRSNDCDRVEQGYPHSNPTEGFTPRDESFAGVIYARAPGGGAQLSLYCIDITTNTYIGFGYGFGTWDAASVPNVGYLARLLNEYYPNTDRPAGLTDLEERAAAVQAAIWFFSDRYVLSKSDPLHGTVVEIVNRIRSEGPLVKPPPPSLTLAPTPVSGPAGSAVGPFKLTIDDPGRQAQQAIVTATGGRMFSNSAAIVACGTFRFSAN